MISKSVTIQLPDTMESRPQAMLVQTASRYRSSIYLKSGNYHVNAKSIMGIMTLKLVRGEQIEVTADGSDEQEALQNMEHYLCCRQETGVCGVSRT